MTALAADRQDHRKDGVLQPYSVAATTTIFGGGLTSINAAGYAVPGADTSGQIFVGVSTQQVINSGAAGAKKVVVDRRGLHLVTLATAITIANVGDKVYLVDDQSVDLIGNTTNDIMCGIITEFVDTTHAYIDIEPAIAQA